MKKVLKFSFIAAVAVAAGYTAYSHSQKAEALSDVALSNVEALARGEIEVGPICIETWQICQIFAPGDELDGVKMR